MAESYKLVKDYWEPTKGWKWENLDGVLPSHIENLLVAILVRSDDEDKDGLCWGPTENGEFSVQSVYALSLPQFNPPFDGIMKQIWKLQIPQRIRTFLWLVSHGKILTNKEKMRRGLISTPYCQCCPDYIEDLDHLFRSCTRVQPFWNKVTEKGSWRKSQTLSFRD